MMMDQWLAENIFQIITTIGLILGAVAWLVRIEMSGKTRGEKLQDLVSSHRALEARVALHVANEEKHVNLPYMEALEKRIDLMLEGNKAIERKVDILVKEIYSMKGRD